MLTKLQTIATVISVLCLSPTATAQQSKEDLAKEMANPITSVTTVPFQFDYDSNIGPGDDGDRFSLNIQPLVSFSIKEEISHEPI